MVFAALHLKMMIKVIKLSGTKTDGELAGASEGFPAFSSQLWFIFHSHLWTQSKEQGSSASQKHCREEYNRHNLSVLELLDLFMPSLDITVKYRRGYKIFPENILMSRITWWDNNQSLNFLQPDSSWQPAAPLSLPSPPTQGSDKVLTAGTAALMICPSFEVHSSFRSIGCKSSGRGEGRGGRCKDPPSASPLTSTCQWVHSSDCGWLWIPSCILETSLAILRALALSWFWHPSCLLSSDVVSFLILPLYGVTSTTGTAGGLTFFVTQSHSTGCCVCADTVSMQPVFQGSCLLYCCALKTSPRVRKQHY